MPDYGHELAFGTFLTPQAQRPERVVALARLTEQAGLDLATFQDHPYQPAFLDTWTLLSWVAASTQTLRLAPNVLNTPLRPPALVARAAASLDRLSGGRLELGLGAGGFWDGIESMGGRRLTPGQSVAALSDAVEVIRGLLDVSGGDAVSVEGEHHRLLGAKRGPEPAHDMEIWLGAYKPRMLRLTGRTADGWLPSLAYTSLEALGEQNRTIDEAAIGAGRDPRAVRRLINVGGEFAARRRGFLMGPAEQWVQELQMLVLEHGFSSFLLASDDPRTIETFGREVAPALREAIATVRRERGPDASPARTSAALSRRRPDVDYDTVPESLAHKAIEPGDRGYERVRSTYSREGSPALVLQPDSVEEVVSALRWARTQSVVLAVRSGGHGISGRSTNDGGIVIDLGRLNRIEVLDAARGDVRLGPGARWGDVARELMPHGLALSSGDSGDVGVGGLATTGGIGLMARKHGLTIDHVTAAEMVLADGRVVRADAEQHPDLFWAVRGAGANFAIVTALELKADRVGEVVFSTMTFDAREPAALLERFGQALEAAPRELTSFLTAFALPGTPPMVELLSVFADDDPAAAGEALGTLSSIGPLLGQRAQTVPYAAIVPVQGQAHRGGPAPTMHSALLHHVTPHVSHALARGLLEGTASMVQLRSIGGAVNDVEPDATAYGHRTQNFVLNAVGDARLDRVWREIEVDRDGLYLSFETDQRPELLAHAWPPQTLERLRRLKRRYDPDQVFNQNFPIPPAPSARGAQQTELARS